ncbi:hypothetical protein T492DRAFT_839613 [Pavlovales sp. CCMP2436]|nr:hypothetical protein T492DRAFT_839613 [Pavlovales sp. CCMP2436]
MCAGILVRGRIERLQHEHRAESKFFGKQLTRLASEADSLEAAHQERALELEEAADGDKGRELTAGRLEEHLAWFQRQARQMEELINVNFRPEEPGGAAETIGHYQRTQGQAQSMWAKINDHAEHAVELTLEVRALSATLATLEAEQVLSEEQAAQEADDLPGTTLGEPTTDEFVLSLLEQLSPGVARVFELAGCAKADLADPGYRGPPPVAQLEEHVDLIDKALKALLLRARQVKQLRKLHAREQAKAEGLSPRSLFAAEERAGFLLEFREQLDPFEQAFDVANKPYDLEEEFTRLQIDASKRELAAELEKRTKGQGGGEDY